MLTFYEDRLIVQLGEDGEILRGVASHCGIAGPFLGGTAKPHQAGRCFEQEDADALRFIAANTKESDMPTIFIRGYKFRFYSSDRFEPPHVHVIKNETSFGNGRPSHKSAPFWIADWD